MLPVGSGCWQCLLAVAVGSGCWQCLLAVAVGSGCWQCLLAVAVGSGCLQWGCSQLLLLACAQICDSVKIPRCFWPLSQWGNGAMVCVKADLETHQDCGLDLETHQNRGLDIVDVVVVVKDVEPVVVENHLQTSVIPLWTTLRMSILSLPPISPSRSSPWVTRVRM